MAQMTGRRGTNWLGAAQLTRALPLMGLRRSLPRSLIHAGDQRNYHLLVFYKPDRELAAAFVMVYSSTKGTTPREARERQPCLSLGERCGEQEAGTRYGYSPESPLRDAIGPRNELICLRLIISYQAGKLSAPTSNSSYARGRSCRWLK